MNHKGFSNKTMSPKSGISKVLRTVSCYWDWVGTQLHFHTERSYCDMCEANANGLIKQVIIKATNEKRFEDTGLISGNAIMT
ncbi:hypothetical protein GOY13_00020 [Wolbachia endosymbiont of Cruorifilaria tuberocauda]|uniref:hypothetical protein n=1 Tax=Wolbachia endosymbiont of Cruorifilaria tuberocauda TaxID=1812111 RepID=UPI00158D99AC|nr:hypothetical protein [Wolbachia endosymbiont of Cruorifilaria tuberocauda]QKX01371.1 hypothetical protein GOY13_00020 [Wolbachia endosymbiont of Cruorifilaria tuberocauda]